MKIRIASILGMMVILTSAFIGCGSPSAVTAPPVELPAPITGRIDISSPDASGNVHITGSAGAVTGGSMLMVVNESASGSSALKLLEILIPKAYAQLSDGFPLICSETGHACTIAADDGSFLLIIPASLGDILKLGIIDPENGEFISDLIDLIIPEIEEIVFNQDCSGLGLSGKAVDIAVAPTTGEPILLKQGSETTSNQLVIGETSPLVVELPGCYAHSIAVAESAAGDIIAVTSKDDRIGWSGTLASGAISDEQRYYLAFEPMHLMFVGDASTVVLTFKVADSVVISRVSRSDGSIMRTIPIGDGQIAGLTQSRRLDLQAMGPNGSDYHLGLVVTEGATPSDAYITLFDADELTHLVTWSAADINFWNPNMTSPIESIVDAAFFMSAAANPTLNIALLDSGTTASYLHTFSLEVEVTGQIMSLDLRWDPSAQIWDSASQLQEKAAKDALEHISVMDMYPGSLAFGIISDAKGNLWVKDLNLDDSLAPIIWMNGDELSAIIADDLWQSLYAADATLGEAVNGTSRLNF